MISVNKDVCIGCGTCVAICPNTFAMTSDGKSQVTSQDDVECAKNAAGSCPVAAIAVE